MKAFFRSSAVFSLLFATAVLAPGANLSAQKALPTRSETAASNDAQTVLYIYTYAGTGIEGYSGDGGPAIEAQLNGPWDVVVDGAGNVFISDFRENRIRKIDAVSGIITTYAGNGSGAYGKDGGPAASASINAPKSMFLDNAGNLIFADSGNNRIRRIDAKTGIISTLAGNGSQGSSGDGGPATQAGLNGPAAVAQDAGGNLYIADFNNHVVRKVDAATGVITTVAGNGNPGYSGDGGPAVNAEFWFPAGVAVDTDGNLYISDSGNNRIRKVDAVTGQVSTVSGDGQEGSAGAGGPAADAELYSPGTLRFDSSGNLFLADTGNSLIREIEKNTGNILTLAGNGLSGYQGDGVPATTTALYFASGMALDSANRLYIADTNNARIRVVQPQSIVVTATILNVAPLALAAGQTLSLNATTTAEGESIPTGPIVFLNGSTVLGQANLDSTGNAHLTLQPASGSYSITARYGGSLQYAASTSSPAILVTVSGPAQTATSLTASSLALTAGQKLTLTATVQSDEMPTPSGTVSFSNGTIVLGNATLNASGVATLTLTPAEGIYSVIAIFAGDSSHLGSNSSPVHIVVSSPQPSSNIYTFAGDGKFGYSGNGGPALDAEFMIVEGITSDPSGNIFIADPQSNVVRRVDHTTGIITAFAGSGSVGEGGDGGPALQAQLHQMQGIASDQDGNIYICVISRVRMVNAKTGIITTVAGAETGGYTTTPGPATSVKLAFPTAVATDKAGDLFISDGANHVVWEVDANTAFMHVIAGTGVIGGSGDGGPATAASIYEPFGVATDRVGNVYIAENLGNRIRKVDVATGIISKVAGTGVAGYSGDGGPATDARILEPTGLVADPDGNVYFSDGSYRVRRVDAVTGIISTAVGDGVYAYGGDGGPATSAEIGSSDLLALDPAGNLYLSDDPPNSIRVRIVGAEPAGSPIGTTTLLTASPSTIDVGQVLTLTATVAAASGDTPAGAVTFTSGSTALGTAVLNSAGIAQLTLTPQAGSYLITANYSGSKQDYPSTSSAVRVTVQADATTTSLSSSSTVLTLGQALTLTATVRANAGPTPSGVVTFLNGASTVGTAQLNSNGVATLTLTPNLGSYALSAKYGGSGTDLASSSAPPLIVVVAAAPSNTVLSASPNPAPFGNRVTFTAIVSATLPAVGVVTFYDGNVLIGTSSLASGVATLSTSSLAAGKHSIVAAYSGSEGVTASISSPVIETITPADFSLAVSPSSRTLYTGEAASFTVAVEPQPGFNLSVGLACQALPANTTCSFSPSTIAGGRGTSTLIIQTTAPSHARVASLAAGKGRSPHPQLIAAAGLMLMALPLGWRLRRRTRMFLLLSISGIVFSTALSGCSNASSQLHDGTPPGTISILVTGNATNGVQTLTHSIRVQLNLKSLF